MSPDRKAGQVVAGERMRRRLPLLAALAMLPCCGTQAMNDPTPDPDAAGGVWPLWSSYVDHFVSEDGRVIDHVDGGYTTSEGQAYGLFHALVANDRETFDRLLGWTAANLCQGDLVAHLPGWKWGLAEDGSWLLLDENSAGDADLWLAYTLIEAGRLWGDPQLEQLGRAVAANVVEQEVVDLPDLGPMLLPGPVGFHPDEQTWRLNPSYLPLQLLARLGAVDPTGPWTDVADSTSRMIGETAPHGFVADWIVYRADQGFVPDPTGGPVGSHDAIRVYLWAGMLHPDEPKQAQLAYHLSGMSRFWRRWGSAPMEVNPWTFEDSGREGSVGFLAALLPGLATADDPGAATRLREQIVFERRGGLYGDPPGYYDQNLLLFGLGFAEGRYRFEADGRLRPAWEGAPGGE